MAIDRFDIVAAPSAASFPDLPVLLAGTSVIVLYVVGRVVASALQARRARDEVEAIDVEGEAAGADPGGVEERLDEGGAPPPPGADPNLSAPSITVSTPMLEAPAEAAGEAAPAATTRPEVRRLDTERGDDEFCDRPWMVGEPTSRRSRRRARSKSSQSISNKSHPARIGGKSSHYAG